MQNAHFAAEFAGGRLFGVGIVEFGHEAAARAFTNADADPAVRSGRGFGYDVWPMPFGVTL